MVKKEDTRLWSKHNVPMEIWTEILVRLPVRSLVRFRCVSRSWKTVIDDPEFCREHLVRFKNNSDETHLLMTQGERLEYCFVRCSDTMKTTRALGHLRSQYRKTRESKNTATQGFDGIWRILFSVDGLVMLKCYVHEKLMLWNPSISKCRLVPEFRGIERLELGLGFDPLIKDYKLVRVSHRTPSSVSIYTVGTDSWKTVAAQGALPSTWPQTLCERRSVYFKGCLYILSGKLISFDLSKEAFKSLDLPEYKKSVSRYVGGSLTLTVTWSSLAVLHSSYRGGSIWVLDDNADATASSWTMRCTFDMGVPLFLYLKKNDDLLFTAAHGFGLQMVSYNIHTKEEKNLTSFPKRTTRVLGYKESLVLLK